MQIAVGNILAGYEVYGSKNKDTILILHGWGRNKGDWLNTAVFLSQKYKVILVDLPGFGTTSHPSQALTIEDYAKFVTDFMEKLSIKSPILIGHSLGGRIGIILGTHKNLLEKLVLVDPAGIDERDFITNFKIYTYKATRILLPHFISNILRSKVASSDDLAAGPIRQTFRNVINQNLKSYLPKITIPTLIIWGEKDESQNVKYAKVANDLIKDSKVRIVWEAGHHPHLEKPQDFNQILKEELL